MMQIQIFGYMVIQNMPLALTSDGRCIPHVGPTEVKQKKKEEIVHEKAHLKRCR